MRFFAHAIVIVVLLAGIQGGAARAQFPKFAGWWPFHEKDEKEEKFTLPSSTMTSAATQENGTATPPAWTPPIGSRPSTVDKQLGGLVAPQAQTQAHTHSSTQSAPHTSNADTAGQPLGPAIRWPEFRMPQFFTGPDEKAVDETRNAWVQKSPDPAKPSPWQAVTDGANRVGTSTKAAWRKSVDVLTPGDNSKPSNSNRVARRNAEPSSWSRMFPREAPQREGPGTVTEWMAQERLKP